MGPDLTPVRVPKTLVLDLVKGMWGSNVVPFSYISVPWYGMSGGPLLVTLDSYLQGHGLFNKIVQFVILRFCNKSLKTHLTSQQPWLT